MLGIAETQLLVYFSDQHFIPFVHDKDILGVEGGAIKELLLDSCQRKPLKSDPGIRLALFILEELLIIGHEVCISQGQSNSNCLASFWRKYKLGYGVAQFKHTGGFSKPTGPADVGEGAFLPLQ